MNGGKEINLLYRRISNVLVRNSTLKVEHSFLLLRCGFLPKGTVWKGEKK